MSTTSYGMARVTPVVDFDADLIAPGLYQGSYPPEGSALRDAGFDAVVLCARDLQTHVSSFPGVAVMYAPSVDDLHAPVSAEALAVARKAAEEVAERIEGGQNVLVTCQAGLNRSGMVTALALHFIYGWSGERCVKHVQSKREEALFNKRFCEALKQINER
jgi:hypothetical protein